jgi:myo-inositol-1(or 4)-monophosphatase
MSLEQRALGLAERLAREAGAMLAKGLRGRRTIATKGNASNLVTDMDRASEAMIVRAIRRAFPGHEIVAEESGRRGASPFRWYVDPLDGTTNYAHGLPIFAVSIGFEAEGEVRAGVVHAPLLRDTYTALKGRGAFLNARRIRCSRQPRLRHALLCTGFPYRFRWKIENLKWWSAFIRRAQAVRRLGSASLDLCWTASGVYDGFWEYHLGPWDIAAACLIAREAGATVTDFRGGPVDLFAGEVLAANARLHRVMRGVLSAARASS